MAQEVGTYELCPCETMTAIRQRNKSPFYFSRNGAGWCNRPGVDGLFFRIQRERANSILSKITAERGRGPYTDAGDFGKDANRRLPKRHLLLQDLKTKCSGCEILRNMNVRQNGFAGFVRVRGARREHNLKNLDVEIPRGGACSLYRCVWGLASSSLAFSTLYAESAAGDTWSRSRRTPGGCFNQMGVPEVDEIDGLPPAVALQQQRGVTFDSLVRWASVTTLSNLISHVCTRGPANNPPETCGCFTRKRFRRTLRRAPCLECHGLGTRV